MMGLLNFTKRQDTVDRQNELTNVKQKTADDQDTPLLNLPSEIIHQVLEFLPCQSLMSLSRTCRLLRHLAQEDLLWANLLSQHIPEYDFPAEPYPSTSYRDLYISHHPYWFLPQYKVWISNEPHVGRIILCQYDPRRGCIEGYRLLAEHGLSTHMSWSYNPAVTIHSFAPQVHLWLDDPVLKLPHDVLPFDTRQGWWEGEIKMSVGRPGHNTLASFFLSRNIPVNLQDPSMELWPPRTIPNMPRVRAASADHFRGKGHKPQRYEEISDTTFRLRHWSQFRSGASHFGVRIGEEVSTWSTIEPLLYTPTAEKPYQGIYVGDYATHGCEFLLIMQTEEAPPPPDRQALEEKRRISSERMRFLGNHFSDYGMFDSELYGDESTSPQEANMDPSERSDDGIVFRGAIEAVKLTGDPNIPRGEHTFIADDIGPDGFIRIAQEKPFEGARVVRSRGHIADRGFQGDEFIPSELIMVDHNTLAQYWLPYEDRIPFGHISYYRRIDLDEILESA